MNLQSNLGYFIITQTLNIEICKRDGITDGQTGGQTNGRSDFEMPMRGPFRPGTYIKAAILRIMVGVNVIDLGIN